MMSGKTIERILKVLIAIVLLILVAGGAVFYFIVQPPAIETGAEVEEKVERATGVYNVLIVGTDKVALNTDTILVLSLDTTQHKVNVMSIPRDTMSNVSRKVKKINAAYAVGGKGNIDQLKTEIRYLMGFEVDNYIVVNLDAFEEIIDALGGVKIDVQRDMHYEDPYQDLYIHIEKGEQILNGEEAIGFVRYRKGYAEGDLGRVKAQQQFIEALAKQVATPATVGKLPKLSSIILENMTTDLTTGELIWFGTKALELNMAEDLTMHILPGEARTVNGLSYYVPKKKELLEIVNNHFNPYPNMITQLNVIDVATIPQPVEKVEEEVVEEVVTEGEVLEGEASETLEDEAGENGVTNEATNTENENVVSDENTEGSNEVLTEETPAEVQGETAEEITEETTEDNAEDNAEETNTEETNTGEEE